jgi:hypothetical protein
MQTGERVASGLAQQPAAVAWLASSGLRNEGPDAAAIGLPAAARPG